MVRNRSGEIDYRSLYNLDGFLKPSYKSYKRFGIGFRYNLI